MSRNNAYDDDNFETVTGLDGKRTRILKDRGRVRISMTMRDSLSPLQRSVADTARDDNRITDGTDNRFALNKPGFRVRTGDTRQKVMDAYQDYDDALANACRCDDEERDGSEDFGNASIKRESLPRHRVDTRMMQDHQERMNKLYADRDRELSDMWRMQ